MLKLRCAWIWRADNRWHGFREHLGDETLLMTSNGDGRQPEPEPQDRAGRLARCYSSGGRRRHPLAEERRFDREVMAGVFAEVNDDLERGAVVTVELADLKATLAEVRLAFATDRTQALELPNPPKRVDLN